MVEFGPKWFHCLNALFWVAKIKLDWNYLGQMIQWTSRKPKAYWLFCIEKKPLESDSLRKILLEMRRWRIRSEGLVIMAYSLIITVEQMENKRLCQGEKSQKIKVSSVSKTKQLSGLNIQ